MSKLIPVILTSLSTINGLDLSLRSLIIPNGSCNNELSMTILNLNQFMNLESIEIGRDCFESVQTFKIEGLDRLRSLKIGNNSFTQVKKYDFDIDVEGSHCKCDIKSKSFHILNCESLESIEIGICSFADFGGEFELKNLINLKSIRIGKIGTTSMNFMCSSFIIRGNTIIMNGLMNVDLPSLQSIELGNIVFYDSLSTIIESI